MSKKNYNDDILKGPMRSELSRLMALYDFFDIDKKQRAKLDLENKINSLINQIYTTDESQSNSENEDNQSNSCSLKNRSNEKLKFEKTSYSIIGKKLNSLELEYKDRNNEKSKCEDELKDEISKLSIASIKLLKERQNFYKCIILSVIFSSLFFICNLLGISISKQYLYFNIIISFGFFFRYSLLSYRIKKDYWASNKYEAKDAIFFILNNADKIDFTDNDGSRKPFNDIFTEFNDEFSKISDCVNQGV